MYAILSDFAHRMGRNKHMQKEDDQRTEYLAQKEKRLSHGVNSRHLPLRQSMKQPEPSGKVSELTVLDRSLTIIEKKALRITWIRMQGRHGTGNVRLCERVFDKLTNRHPQLRTVFCQTYVVNLMSKPAAGGEQRRMSSTATIHDHAKLLSEYIDYCISWLNDEKEGIVYDKNPGKTTKAKAIGRSHICLRDHGVKSEIWEQFGECLAEEVLYCEAVRACMKGHRAWNMLIVTIVDHLRAGFDNARKIQESADNNQAAGVRRASLSPAPSPIRDRVPSVSIGSGAQTHRPSRADMVPIPRAVERLMGRGQTAKMGGDYDGQRAPYSAESSGSDLAAARRGSWHNMSMGSDDEPVQPRSVAEQEAYFDRLFDNSATIGSKRSMSVVHL